MSGITAKALLVILALAVGANVYADINDLIKRDSVQQLAEAAARDNNLVNAAILSAAAADEDLGAWTAEARVAVAAAVANINSELKDASAQIDGYIGNRYPAISNPQVLATLKTYALDIAAWRIRGGDRESEEYLAYSKALDWLTQVARGQVGLNPTGAEAPSAQAAGARAAGPAPLFSRARLAAADKDREY